MKIVKVVCGIIYFQDKILLARRKEGKSMASKWEFPGGKVETNELEIEALQRELLEEFGMEVIVKEKFANNIHDYGTISINLIAYSCDFISATFKLTDHDAYVWVSPEALHTYDLAAADIPFLALINQS